jgi:hypothetical protein
MNVVSIFVLLYVLLVCSVSAGETKERNGLPRSLWASAWENSCDDLTNFYKKTRTNHSPFTFGVVPNSRESAAYVCNSETIIIWQQENEWIKPAPFSCSNKVQLKRVTAGGLSIENKKGNVSDYYSLDSAGWIKGPDVIADLTVIKSHYDGLSSHLVCYKNKWYFNNYD